MEESRRGGGQDEEGGEWEEGRRESVNLLSLSPAARMLFASPLVGWLDGWWLLGGWLGGRWEAGWLGEWVGWRNGLCGMMKRNGPWPPEFGRRGGWSHGVMETGGTVGGVLVEYVRAGVERDGMGSEERGVTAGCILLCSYSSTVLYLHVSALRHYRTMALWHYLRT